MVEGCRCPAIDRVTHRAAMIISAGHVIGILHALIVGLMACIASGRRARVLSADMTGETIDGDVRPLQREVAQIVIKRRRRPAGRGVALIATMTELTRHVIGIGRPLIVLRMAGIALRRVAAVLAVDMALRTTRGDVRSGERETHTIMIERGGFPRRRIMTFLAGVRQLINGMIWTHRAVIRCLMARPAICGRIVVLPIDVALRARGRDMRAG